MKTEALLNDILLDSDFRESLRERIETEARRKRVARRAQGLAVAAALALVASLWTLSRHTALATAKPEPTFVIHSTALADSQIIATHSTANIAIATDPSKSLPSISDEELIRLFPKQATAIASIAHKARRFFFINPKDAEAFMATN